LVLRLLRWKSRERETVPEKWGHFVVMSQIQRRFLDEYTARFQIFYVVILVVFLILLLVIYFYSRSVIGPIRSLSEEHPAALSARSEWARARPNSSSTSSAR
jgi:nitrate/nitrite-specific signal transduction histidine kinase